MSEQSPVFMFDSEDPSMEAASVAARKTFRYFWRELSWEARRIVPGFDLTIAKAAFAEGDKVEHMWFSEIDFDGERVYGTLLNSPNELRDLHAGDDVAIALGHLEDWMLAGAAVLGGFTVHAMRSQMSDEDRSSHDQAWGLPFGDPKRIALPPDGDDHPMALNMADKLVEALTDNAAAFLAPDDQGWTMLHREALAGNRNVCALLIEHGANVNAKTADGKTPRSLAETLDWQRVIDVLQRS
ncbi:MAG TPA: DUF2314 domain-containing protein [Polyangiaceae bacterium]|nr:DUF2314 domain-containing protein [Polyangiaceae bacterium]HMR76865.1 DUF2314 domain-containing protein [Polyangiaceae bacterium]